MTDVKTVKGEGDAMTARVWNAVIVLATLVTLLLASGAAGKWM